MKSLKSGIVAIGFAVTLAGCGGGGGAAETEEGAAGNGSEAWQPSEPVTVIVPYDAGGGTDAVFRQVAQIVNDQELSSQRWVVENRTGGAGTTGMRYVAQQEGNEHLLLATTPGHIAVPASQDMDLRVTDLTAVANTLIDPQVLYTSEGSGYDTVEAIVEQLQSEPESVSMGGGPIAQDDHLTTLLFERATDTQVNYIAFDGGGDLKAAMLGGQVDVAWLNPSEAAGQTVAEGGTLVPVAVALDERLEDLPDVPTFTELGYDVVYDMFFRALTAPPGLSPEVVDYYAGVVEEVTNTEEWQQFIDEAKVEPHYLGGEDFAAALKEWSEEIESLLQEGN